MKKILTVLLCAALLAALPLSAMADLKRGDQGEAVLELQNLLWKCGWVFDEPDGVFGKNTEKGVKSYQISIGETATGIADDALIARLRHDKAVLFGEPLPGEGQDEDLPERCQVHVENGTITVSFCAEHLALFRETQAMAKDLAGSAAAAKRWADNIEAMTSEWSEAALPADKLDVLAAFGAWKGASEQQRAALELLFPQDDAMVELQMCQWYQNQAAALCALRLTGEAAE